MAKTVSLLIILFAKLAWATSFPSYEEFVMLSPAEQKEVIALSRQAFTDMIKTRTLTSNWAMLAPLLLPNEANATELSEADKRKRVADLNQQMEQVSSKIKVLSAQQDSRLPAEQKEALRKREIDLRIEQLRLSASIAVIDPKTNPWPKTRPQSYPTDNLSTMPVEDTRLRCFYAGFGITGAVCRPKSSVVLFHNGVLTTYGCQGVTSDNMIVPDPVIPDRQVLCHPLLFGTVNDKPICVAAGRDASRNCDRTAGTRSLESARLLALENPKDYNKLRSMYETYCAGDNEQAIVAHLAKSVADKTQLNINDMAKTCMVYNPRFQKLPKRVAPNMSLPEGQH